MPFTFRRDVAPAFNLGNPPYRASFAVPPPPAGAGRSMLDAVRPRVAEREWDDVRSRAVAAIGSDLLRAKREVARLQAERLNYRRIPDRDAILDELWNLIKVGRNIQGRSNHEAAIESDLREGYRMAAVLAMGAPAPVFPDAPTLSRTVDRDDRHVVVFSDHHFTDFERLPNYFADHNLELYLDVLTHYAEAREGYCLVENGDVEDPVIFEPDLAEAEAWWTDAGWGNDANLAALSGQPMTRDDDDWQVFFERRYETRTANLQRIIQRFQPYYTLVRERFEGRYVRLTGNHDTYLDDTDLTGLFRPREVELRDLIEAELGTRVADVMRLKRPGSRAVSHLILHGHQFDRVCVQHGATPYALTLGEVYSECLSWAYQGPDRFWANYDARQWHVRATPLPFANRVAFADPGDPADPTTGNSAMDLLTILNLTFGDATALGTGTVQGLLKHEVAWEYFENQVPIEAIVLELFRGEEMWKFRHMNERALCDGYVAAYQRESGRRVAPAEIPRLVLGHTHEPRHLPAAPDGSAYANGAVCVNCGSAGRFQGLIWCVEIHDGEERVCSWSRDRDRLKKVVWKASGAELVPEEVSHV